MTCRSCGCRTTEVMDFGQVALAGAFLKPADFHAEQTYPLTLQFCEKCLLLQTGESIPAATLFEHYFYRTSAIATMREHFAQYAAELVKRFHPSNVLEIGCNDGVLLRPLHEMGVEVLGVDPARNVTPTDLPVINAFWGEAFARDRWERYDLIVANNVFAHIEDINGAVAAVDRMLAAGGTFAFEVNSLDRMIYDLQYDWVYHEHLFYYSLAALENLLARHGLMVYDLQRLATHAGSMRYFACRKGDRPQSDQVRYQREREMWQGLYSAARFKAFAAKAAEHRTAMRELVGKYTTVAGYGACGRTNTMLQWCGLDSLAYIVDDAPAKQGFYTPGTHIPIVDAERLHMGPPECLIVFAWSFLAEIQPKLRNYRGTVVIPLPHIYQQKERVAA